MENLFLKYMRERSDKPKSQEAFKPHNKPVITISREYGCPGERIAEKLTELLLKKDQLHGGKQHWRWVSKEIIEQSAKKLKMTPSMVNELSKKGDSGFFDNVAVFFSDMFYPSDGKIQNAIAGFIHETASEGNVVILGRASEIITHNFLNSIHVKLFAPLEWRAEVTSIQENVSMNAAKKICEENDARREKFRKHFSGPVNELNFYNAIFNCKELTDEEIIEMVLILAETRGFV
jgi:hypothetical protein